MSATGPIRILVAVDAGIDRDALDAALPDTSDIHVVGLVDTLESLQPLHEAPADVLVVACAGYSERALLVIDTAAREHPERPVVVLVHGSANGFVRRAFEAGADDIVVLPDAPENVVFALQKALVRKRGGAGGGASGPAPLICMLGPKGGAGKTVTAVNLATALAMARAKPVLVDLDLQFGDVGLALGLTPERTIADLARAGGALDEEKVDAYLTEHSSGLRVLLAPTRPDHASFVTVEFLRDLYAALRTMSDYVIVDTPPGFTPEVIATIDNATQTCLVAALDSLSLKNTKLGLETLDLMGFGPDRITLVLNRADSRVGLERADVVAVLGREPDVLVPSDREVSRSVNEAVPIVLKERSEAAKAFRALADRYPVRQVSGTPAENGRAPAKPRGLFAFARRS